MDWVMIGNAENALHRVQSIYYLNRFRYQFGAREGGAIVAGESPGNLLCAQTMAELRAELSCPTGSLAMVGITDDEARSYLTELLQSFDRSVANQRAGPHAKVDQRHDKEPVG